ncbi:MAG: glycosyltransferase family 4 protein [Chloroflexi bacterium]|nr:glycosyltransferase family 4 protein [Chloroflexota bacterium]
MSRLHIAMFTNTYLPFTNGITRSVNSFRQAMVEELDHNVFIFAQGVSEHDYEDKEPFIYRYPSLDIPFEKYPLTIPVSRFVKKLMPSLKLDVIHAHHPAPMGIEAANYAKDLDLPLVFTHHTRYQEYNHYLGLPEDVSVRIIESWIADYMQQCQHIIVPSKSIRQMIEQTYGLRQRMTVIPTGIETKPYKEADRSLRQKFNWGDDTVLISVGRMAEEKNWPTLLDAAKIVFAQRPQARLLLLGDGPARHDLEKYAAKLGIGNRVTFTGNVPFNDVPKYLKAADLFCFASVTETQGLVTLEAMAAGLPVVCVDATGTSDAVDDGVQGLLTPNDSQALAAGIERMLADKALYGQFQEAAVIQAAKFDIVTLAQQMTDVYAQAKEDKQAGLSVQMDEKKKIFKVDWKKPFAKIESEIAKLERKIVKIGSS